MMPRIIKTSRLKYARPVSKTNDGRRRSRIPLAAFVLLLVVVVVILTLFNRGSVLTVVLRRQPLPRDVAKGSLKASDDAAEEHLTLTLGENSPPRPKAGRESGNAAEGDEEAAAAAPAVAATPQQKTADGSSSSSTVTPISRPAEWFTGPFASNPHFLLDNKTMPDEFLDHLQFMSNRIASDKKWQGSGWTRFDKKDISECSAATEEVLPLWTTSAAPSHGRNIFANSYLSSVSSGAKVSGLSECELWRAIAPRPLLAQPKKKKGDGAKKNDDADADNDGEVALAVAPEPLTPAQLQRPYRKCCAEHAKLRDTAFYVFDHLEANNITYFLATGTALGAIRHKGSIIPWDTDVDLVIYPSDAKRAKELFKALSAAKEISPDRRAALVKKDTSAATPDTMYDTLVALSKGRHFYSPDPQGKPMFWVHASKDGRPNGGPHVEIFYEDIYTSYPDKLLPLVKCPFYGRAVSCPNPAMFGVWFPSGWEAYSGGHYHGKSRCTVFIKGVKYEVDKC